MFHSLLSKCVFGASQHEVEEAKAQQIAAQWKRRKPSRTRRTRSRKRVVRSPSRQRSRVSHEGVRQGGGGQRQRAPRGQASRAAHNALPAVDQLALIRQPISGGSIVTRTWSLLARPCPITKTMSLFGSCTNLRLSSRSLGRLGGGGHGSCTAK